MKRITCIFLCAFILICLLCSCNTNSGKNTITNKENKQSSTTEKENSNISETETIENVNKIDDFSEGLAWINYGDEPSYWGCINKQGEILFTFNKDEYVSPSEYNNGYSYIESAGGLQLHVIDKKGSICSSYDVKVEEYDGHFTTTITNGEEHVVAYGYGYTVVQTHKADFDEAYYLYSIYDANGNVLDTYKTKNDEEISVNYCGKGIFYLDYDDKRHYFFAETKKWVDTEYSGIDDVKFYDNYALLDIAYINEDAYRGEFIFMDLEGNIKKTKISDLYGWDYGVNSLYDDVCLFIDSNSTLCTYDIKTNTFSKLTNENYLSKVDWERCDEIIYNDNAIIVPLIGEDNEDYLIVFDKEWNTVIEPFKATQFSKINDDRFIIDNKLIYDTDGNLICDVTTNNMLSVRTYYDGVTIANDTEDAYIFAYGSNQYFSFKFLDTNGKELFENITKLNED